MQTPSYEMEPHMSFRALAMLLISVLFAAFLGLGNSFAQTAAPATIEQGDTAAPPSPQSSVQTPSDGQSGQDARADAVSAQIIDPTGWRAILDSTQQALTREGLSDADLEKLRAEVQKVAQEAAQEADKWRKEVELVEQRINTLGPVPEDGQPAEPAPKQEQRRILNEEFARVDADLRLARQTAVRADQLSNQIGSRRYERFFRSITQRSESVFTGTFWNKFGSGFSGFARSLSLLVTDSGKVFANRLMENPVKLVGLGILLPLVLLGFIRIRRMLLKLSRRIPEHTLTAPVEGFVFYIRHGVLPALLLVALHAVPSYLGLFTPRLEELLLGAALALGFYLVFIALVRVIFAPSQPSRRIAMVSDGAALRIFRTLSIGLAIASMVHVLNVLSIVIVAPIEKRVGFSMIFGLVIALSSIRALMIYRADRLEQLALGGPKTQSKFWKVLVIGLWAASLAILLSALVGYVALAEFLSQQLVFGVIVVLTAWLLLRFIDYIFLHLTADDEVEWGGEAAVSGSGGQAAILGSGVLKLFVYVAASVLLMLPWGYRTSDFFQIFQQAFFGFEVGGLSISISTILLALALFMIGYTVTVALRGWLNNKLLPTTSLDIGISNSISTVFGYIGVLVAAMLAISAAGFDLSNLAIVAGALSVGIGFGLQSIVSNFVSGLILLAERPIKAGDWVSTSGGDGYVRKISVRSTEIETFDRATVIVPNSSLITETVTNWTHGSKIGRIIIPIGVAYNSDPEQVQAILLQCAKDHKLVLGRPEPVVYFMDFGASSLDFQLRCFLSDINYGIVVQSELRFAILKALREAKIEIPFPQREVLVKNAEAETPVKPRRSRKAEPKAAD